MKVGYVRISTRDQDPLAQVNLVIKSGVSPEHVFVDQISGNTDPMSRPEYLEMIGFVKGRMDTTSPVEELIVTEFSRIGRGTHSTFVEMFNLKKYLKLKVVSLSEKDSPVMTFPEEYQPLMLSVACLAADIERSHHIERTKYGMDLARKNGKKIGRPAVVIDWDKVKAQMKKYKVSENVARKLCGYSQSTFYRKKGERT